MSIIEKQRKESVTLSLFFAHIFMIPFQVLFLWSTITAAAIQSLQTSRPDVFFPNSIITAVVYFVLPVIYCIVVSLLFHPKRIVLPLNIQIGTMMIFSIMVIYQAMNTLTFTTESSYPNLIGALTFIALLAFSVGFVQLITVRWVVGSNFDSVDRISFLIDKNPNDVVKILSTVLHDVWGFNRRKANPNAKVPTWILKHQDPSGISVVLAIGPQPENTSKSILATVAYRNKLYGISQTNIASETRSSIINDIEKRLKQSANLTLISSDNVNDHVSVKANSFALAGTRSKIEITAEFLRDVSKYYLYALVITVAAFFAVTFAYIMKVLTIEAYIGAIIVVVFTLVIDLGALLRDEFSKREIEEID